MSAGRSTDLLINDPKYSWLRDLGLQEDNPGVFNGTSWSGSGQVRSLFMPHSLFYIITDYHFRISSNWSTNCSCTAGLVFDEC